MLICLILILNKITKWISSVRGKVKADKVVIEERKFFSSITGAMKRRYVVRRRQDDTCKGIYTHNNGALDI